SAAPPDRRDARPRARGRASGRRRDPRSVPARQEVLGRRPLRAVGGRRLAARRRGRAGAGRPQGPGGDGGAMKVLYLFGPNLGALGRRDPERYGAETLEEIMR